MTELCPGQIMEDKESRQADKATQVLSNLTRDQASSAQVFQHLQRADIGVESVVRLLCQEKYNNQGLMMNFLGPVLSNLSQLPQVRKQILGGFETRFEV